MKTEHFKKLSISDDWWQHLISYPNGFTIYENLIDWVSRTNAIIKNVNEWNDYLEDFVSTFEKELQGTVIDTLRKWQDDGTLDIIIDEALQTQIDTVEDNLNHLARKVPENFGVISLVEHPQAKNPVLTRNDVTDLNAKFVADPFFCYENGVYHMFFEVAEDANGTDLGHIGHATSDNGIDWNYNKIVLRDGNHFAYPFVFKHDGQWYMLPDRGGSVPGLTLYRATNFPEEWVADTRLFSGGVHIDATPIYWRGTWYLIDYNGSQVNVYYSDDIRSTDWTLHPASPILTGSQIRPGGRPIITDDYIEFFMQDGSSGIYGEKLNYYRILELSRTTFRMRKFEKPILEATGNKQWNSRAMHHLDLMLTNKHSLPIAIVDGRHHNWAWGIGVYTIGSTKRREYYRALLGGTQTIPRNEWTKINFQTNDFDSHKTFDSGSYRITENGLYTITFSVSFIAQHSTIEQFLANVALMNNGAQWRTTPRLVTTSLGAIRQSINYSDTIMLHRGDKLELEFYQGSPNDIDIIQTGGATFLTIARVD